MSSRCVLCGAESVGTYCDVCRYEREKAVARLPDLLCRVLVRGFRSDGERSAYERCVAVLTEDEVARFYAVAEEQLSKLGFLEMTEGG